MRIFGIVFLCCLLFGCKEDRPKMENRVCRVMSADTTIAPGTFAHCMKLVADSSQYQWYIVFDTAGNWKAVWAPLPDEDSHD